MSTSLRICLGAVAAYVTYACLAALFSPLRKVPGPFLARFTKLWKLREIYRGHFEKTNIELHARYGPVVRIAPDEYSIDDPDAAREIYGLGGQFIKSEWYIASGNADPHAIPDLFSDRNAKRHAVNRRKVASLYSMSSLVKMEGFVNECTDLLVSKLRKSAQLGESVDVAHWLQCYAFDVIGHITLAKRFGFLDNGDDIGGIMAAISDYLAYSAYVGVFPDFHRPATALLTAAAKLSGNSGSGMGAMFSFGQRVLNSRIAEPGWKEGGGDFLSHLLKLHGEDPQKITKEEIFTSCMTNIGAGSDTTSISLGSIIYHLCRYPNTMQALRDEISSMSSEGKISDPVTFSESQQMPYLQAVIKEALRMHPATGLPLGRVVPAGGKALSGISFPAGTTVGVNSWVAHANTQVFGNDAHLFRPERWLESKEKSLSMDRYFFAFGMGSRTCVGKNISLLEMAKLIPQLVRKFDISLTEPDKLWETKNRWFVKQRQYFCTFRERQKQ
ncbi:cytochrome P450 oxidoreductase [Coniochaeta sp. 2T2.1]|nr:cytochrome P450 oxidoreductase [Coniochaeta sp. 2T2.1]